MPAVYSTNPVMGRERRVAICRLRVRAEAILDSYLRVVEDDPFGRAAKELEGLHQRIEEALAVLPSIRDDERYVAVAEPRTE